MSDGRLLVRPVLGSPASRRRVLHGDWHPLLRDPIDLLRLNYPIGAVVFFCLGNFSAAWDLAASTVLVLLVRALDPPRRFDLAFIIAMAFNGWGDALGLFDKFSWYDNLVHFTVPLAIGPLAYLALVRLDVVPPFVAENTRRHRVGMAIIVTSLGVAAAAGYEIYEFIVDQAGASLFVSESDTVNDLADGFAGAAAGGLLLAALARRNIPVRRGALEERQRGGEAAKAPIEHDSRSRAEGRADHEVAGREPGQAAGVVEGSDR